MKLSFGIILLVVAAFIAFATALAHMSCIYLGPECYAVQMAPPEVVESAQNGTLLAPIGTLIVASVFIIMGCYALSAARLIRALPKLTVVVYTISALCIIRGILPIQLWIRHPEKVTEAVLYVGLAWLATGLFYFLGFRQTRHSHTRHNHTK